ncbi:MAG: hypothetical protein K0R09_3816 [Clostridiales bacterium]|nr:hypothetical protein [Clostridiales bacterium]
MNKQEFMGKLSYALANMPSEEKNDILYDYEEHFRIALEKGKTEEEAAGDLGNPEAIAKAYKANAAINKAEADKSVKHITGAVFAVLGLGFVNLVFILGPYLGIVGALLGFFAASVGIVVAGIVGVIAAIFQPVLPEIISMPVNQGAVIFAMVGLGCLGLLMFIGCCYLAKLLYTVTIKYLKFNLRIIQK